MQQDVDLSDFTGGELSPKLKGRTDLKKYFSSCDTHAQHGGDAAGRRHQAAADPVCRQQQEPGGLNRPVRFVFSTVQAYTLEFSNTNVRIYANDGVVLKRRRAGGCGGALCHRRPGWPEILPERRHAVHLPPQLSARQAGAQLAHQLGL
jgi:hypothetical protein